MLEIGAGTGELTHALHERGARVTAVEIDDRLVDILQSRDDLRGVEIVHADALDFDFEAYALGGPWRVAGNLPYNVATPLLVRLAEMEHGPDTIVAMIQKDVADRLLAKPATPAYGSLTIAVQCSMQVERAFTLGPQAFYPRPKVDSTVVRLIRRDAPLAQPRDLPFFRRLVRAAFAYRRKTLVNSVSHALGIDRARIAQALTSIDLEPEVRGEQLDILAFARLADALCT